MGSSFIRMRLFVKNLKSFRIVHFLRSITNTIEEPILSKMDINVMLTQLQKV